MTMRIKKPLRLILATALLAMAASPAVSAGEATGKGFPIRSGSAAPASFDRPAGGRTAPLNGSSIHSYNPTRQAQAYPAPASSGGAMAMAPAAAPAPAFDNNTQAFEAQPLAFPETSRRNKQRNDGDRDFTMPSIWPALLTVAAVCAAFCTILYMVKKYLPGHRQLFSHPSMEVLGRTHIDQRRYVSLLRVGKRIIVVGVSPDEMRSLSEITDDEEITSIMEVARPKTEAGLSIFQKLFKKTVVEADAEETRVMAREKVRELDKQMGALRRRVQGIGDGDVVDAEKQERAAVFDAVG